MSCERERKRNKSLKLRMGKRGFNEMDKKGCYIKREEVKKMMKYKIN
jgi:hypothetical protein